MVVYVRGEIAGLAGDLRRVDGKVQAHSEWHTRTMQVAADSARARVLSIVAISAAILSAISSCVADLLVALHH